MHEQKHREIHLIQPNQTSGGGDALIGQLAENMRRFAVSDPCLTHDTLEEAVKSGRFGKYLQIKNTISIYVLLTVSPSKNESETPFWHCSMSIVSNGSGRAKSLGLWTRRENSVIQKLLPEFLGNAGKLQTQTFIKTISAVHCYRDLTSEELEQINWRKN